MKIVYISGKYSDSSYAKVDFNISKAREMALEVIKELHKFGVYPFVPHLNSAHFDSVLENVNYKYWIKSCVAFLKKCDVVLMLDNWKDSKGAVLEKKIADRYNIPVFFSLEDLKKYVISSNISNILCDDCHCKDSVDLVCAECNNF